MKYISLFAGIGGFDLALNRLGHECVYANDFDKFAAKIYEKNFGHKPDTRDIAAVSIGDIPDHDLLVGGFPCQSFSIGGKRKGFIDIRGTCFFTICKIVKIKKPDYLLLENVEGLLTHDNGQTFTVIIKSLDELGYDLQWQVINSKYFTGQNRKRIYIFASFRGKSRPQIFPLFTTTQRHLTQIISTPKKIMACITTRSALSRLAPDLGFVYQNGRIRDVTILERERLQGFPDHWTEGVSDTQRYKQLGNAVTVNVVHTIAERFSESHNGEFAK